MKLYDFPAAPNPRRVRVLLAEKGIEVPYEQVDFSTERVGMGRLESACHMYRPDTGQSPLIQRYE